MANVTTQERRGSDGNSTRRRQRLEFEEYKGIFERTVRTYAAIRCYPVISASNPDPDGSRSRPHKWRPDLAHFCIDVEIATEAALGENSLDLQAGWFSLAMGEAVPPEIERAVVSRCGKIYKRKGLDPRRYLHINPRGCDEE
jgi:hypothetical protein